MTPRIVDAVVLGRHGVVPVRHYEPDAAAPASQPTVVWLHGGGFTHGDLDMPESHAVSQVLARSGSFVVAVDYRRVPVGGWWRRPKTGVVPDVRHPVPLEDVVDVVTQTLSEHGTAISSSAERVPGPAWPQQPRSGCSPRGALVRRGSCACTGSSMRRCRPTPPSSALGSAGGTACCSTDRG